MPVKPILRWLVVDVLCILFGREIKIDEAFNAWREEIIQSGDSILSTVLKKRYDDLVVSRDKLISGSMALRCAMIEVLN